MIGSRVITASICHTQATVLIYGCMYCCCCRYQYGMFKQVSG